MQQSQHKDLYAAQEAVYSVLKSTLGASFQDIKLCGGTPLARCYLHHRISYDLDFFLPPDGELIKAINAQLRKSPVGFVTDKTWIEPDISSQVFGYVIAGRDIRVDISFIEDRWFNAFPHEKALMGGTEILTESIEGLYHRKLRTVSGFRTEKPTGGRQTARDIFDLCVLSKTVKPIPTFISTLDNQFSEDTFYEGLSDMDWLKISEELEKMVVAPQWNGLREIDTLLSTIIDETNMTDSPECEDSALEDDDGSRCSF